MAYGARRDSCSLSKTLLYVLILLYLPIDKSFFYDPSFGVDVETAWVEKVR